MGAWDSFWVRFWEEKQTKWWRNVSKRSLKVYYVTFEINWLWYPNGRSPPPPYPDVPTFLSVSVSSKFQSWSLEWHSTDLEIDMHTLSWIVYTLCRFQVFEVKGLGKDDEKFSIWNEKWVWFILSWNDKLLDLLKEREKERKTYFKPRVKRANGFDVVDGSLFFFVFFLDWDFRRWTTYVRDSPPKNIMDWFKCQSGMCDQVL